jgi:superfamily II DNA or RNA helicase
VLVATIAGEGLNFPAVDCVVLAGGQRSPIRLLQNIGRGGRASGDQARTINVIDTFDLGHPITIRHSRERRRTCVAAGYQVSGAGG